MKRRKPLILLLVICLMIALSVPVFAAADDEESDDISLGDVLLGNASLGELFSSLFERTVGNWLAGIINDGLDLIGSYLQKGLTMTFKIEVPFQSDALNTTSLRNIYTYLYSIASILVVLKVLFRGFQIYVLWRNGDSEASPRDMVVGALEAQVAILAFPYLYTLASDVVVEISQTIMGYLGGTTVKTISSSITTMFFNSFFTTVALLVWLIMVLILLVRTVKLGIELLILRLGFPFATLGLIDSDMALFKNYIQVFIKTFFTLIIQVVLLSLSIRVIASTTSTLFGWLFGIALASTALSAPKLLQQFLAPSGGGGGGAMYKLSSAAMLARSVAALFV